MRDYSRTVAHRVRRLRAVRGLTQEGLYLRAGISRDVMQKVESGGHNPTLYTLLKIAKALGVPVAELLE
nr:helix-turn-helix transcriptional regulator [Streptomyces sp. SID4982]